MMDGDLSIQGTIEETTVPDLLRSLLRSNETAIVSLEASGRYDTVYVADGKIVYASTSDSDLGLAEVLLRCGDINLAQYRDVMESETGGRKMGAVLFERGYLKPEDLTRAVERQVTDIVTHALAARNGNYTIEFVEDLGKDIIALQISTEKLMLDGIRRIDHWSLIERGVGKLSRVLRQTADADRRVYHLDLTDEESHVYAMLNEPQTIATLCERSYLTNFVTCRTLWALLSINVVDDAELSAVDEKRSAIEQELELEAIVERYNSAYQAIFGMIFQRIGDHVYDFVDRVVLHLSPEIFPYLSGVNLMNESRLDFDQLLNNLIASGSEDRPAIVNSVLNELLYAWVTEIRKEFGAQLDDELEPIISAL